MSNTYPSSVTQAVFITLDPFNVVSVVSTELTPVATEDDKYLACLVLCYVILSFSTATIYKQFCITLS